jgi:cysteinyl-tRNA synthetase
MVIQVVVFVESRCFIVCGPGPHFSSTLFSGQGNGSSSRLTERFGPNGYDYKLCDDAGPSISPLSDDEIYELIAERLECKLNRDFERANEIKKDLMEKEVALDDINRMWRADGVRIFVGKGRNNKLDYNHAPDAGPSQATMTDEEVAKLLAELQECRYNRDFDQADRIRDDLLEAGVQIDYKNRLWRADGKSFRNENRDGHNEEDLFGKAETYHGDEGSGFR